MSNGPMTLTTFEKARARMLINHPFFASIVLSTEFIETDKVPTACTDMVKVWYNPKFIGTLDVDEVIFVLVHEIMHMVLKHGFRRGFRKPVRWNVAGDYAINQELVDAKLKMPKITQRLIDAGYASPDKLGHHFGLLEPTKYAGLTAEQIYDMLTQERDKQGKKKKKGQGQKGQGSDPGDGAGGPPDDDDEDDELGPLGQDLSDAIGDKTDAELSQISQDIDGKIAQAATMARAAGKMPGNLDILVDGVLNPPQPWEMILREFMTRMVQSAESWTRRNRRYIPILPSRISSGMGELCIIGDTSASMLGDKIYAQLAAEINYCNEYVKPERTRVVWADYAACSGEQVFEPGEDVKLEPKGGGGTDMRLPLKYLEQYEPCIVLLVTDCETPWPDQPTPYPLIVCATTRAKSPDWAMRLELRS
jgi:predicted metal-dependent peptidase